MARKTGNKKIGSEAVTAARKDQQAKADARKAEVYTLGKPYRPKAEHNQRTWERLQKALTAGPKTLDQLGEIAKEVEHGDFVGYMLRGGHIAPASRASR